MSTSSTNEITEATAIVRARAFVRKAGIDRVPVDLEKYVQVANAEVRSGAHLRPGEAGNTMCVNGRHYIVINPADRPERQRFTVLHEIAHIVLELPSRHGDGEADALFSYAKRPREEVLCDVFAAECLLPHEFLIKDLKVAQPGFAFVEQIAERYEASLSSTLSRVVVNSPMPCACVLSQAGHIRFAAYSATMRERRFWITPRIAIPVGSLTLQSVSAGKPAGPGPVPAYVWSSVDELDDLELTEEVRLLSSWDQALTLLWCERKELSHLRQTSRGAEDDEGVLLKELDGTLPWPGKKRRR
jgi:Zn-dependent peptidase ImmA (M78 family)